MKRKSSFGETCRELLVGVKKRSDQVRKSPLSGNCEIIGFGVRPLKRQRIICVREGLTAKIGGTALIAPYWIDLIQWGAFLFPLFLQLALGKSYIK
ncbi:hypothetical protein EFR21_07135 [Lactobacillus delbrueckii subsp. bulgaricus]|nr:hypothetical protein [Lactobacillus delbrueckii subsp. bulgaricus]